MKDYDKLCELYQNVMKASYALQKELETQYPKGTKIRCWLKHNQKTPSIMTVMRCDGNGNVRSFMEKRNGRFVRDIMFNKIYG